MSAIDVLARALQEVAWARNKTKMPPWEALDETARDTWRQQAEVIAKRMLEAEGGTGNTPYGQSEPLNLEGSITTLHGHADYLNDVSRTADQHDPTRLIQLLATLRGTIRTLQTVDAYLVRDIYLRAEHGEQDIEGVGRVKIIRSRDRRNWEPREAVFAYVDARMVAAEGEVPDPMDVADWVMEVLPATASTSCKVTALKNVGLDPQAFCEDTPGPIRVELPSRS